MCRICDDYNSNPNTVQTIRNLFEAKEQLGVEHTNEVVALADINLNYREPEGDGNHKIGKMCEAIQQFVTPASEPEIDRSQL